MQRAPQVLLITLSAVVLCTSVLVAYAVRVARSGRAYFPRLGSAPGSALLPGWLVEGFYWAMHAPARLLTRSGVDPDTLTYVSLVLCAASTPLLATGRFALATLVIVLGATFDAMDGMVARARGMASASGAVLDSFVDRVADAAPFVGLAIFYRGHPLTLVVPLAAMLASSLVSYARAKADIYGLAIPNGVMRRHERIVYLVASLLAAPLVPTLGALPAVRYPLTLVGLALIAAVGLAASVLLVARTRTALSAREVSKPPLASAPARGPHPTTP